MKLSVKTALLHTVPYLCSTTKKKKLFRSFWNVLRKDALRGFFLSRQSALQGRFFIQERLEDGLLPKQFEKLLTFTPINGCMSPRRRRCPQSLANLFRLRYVKRKWILDSKNR